MSGRRPAALVGAAAGWLLMAAAGCGHDPAAPLGAASGRLHLAFRTAPWSAPAAPIVGPVELIRIGLYDAANRLVVPIVDVPIAPEQVTFEATLDAPAGSGLAVRALAIGRRPIKVPGGPAGGPPLVGSGILFRGQVDGLVLGPLTSPTVEIEFTPFVPEIAPPEFSRQGSEHTIHWTDIRGAHRYRLTIIDPRAGTRDTLVADTTWVGLAVPVQYSVAALDGSGLSGAPSDYVAAIRPGAVAR